MGNLRQCETIMTIVDLNPKKIGSFEMFTIALSKQLNAFGKKNVLVFSSGVPEHLKHMYEGIVVETVSMSNGIFDSYPEIYRLFKKYSPDIVHLHFCSFFAFKNIPIYMFGQKRIIFTDHSSMGSSENFGIKGLLVFFKNKILIKYIEKIICVSNYICDRDEKIPGIEKNKLLCIYNGVDLERFQPTINKKNKNVRNELKLNSDVFVVVTAVSLIKVKGIDYLIRAAKILSEKNIDIVFLIAGDGEERAELEALSKELGVADSVQFLGMRNDVEEILQASDVYLYPSIWQEACALGLIEAMACGLPVIATRVGGTPEIVDDGITGIIIEPKDSRSISEAIEILYNDNGKLKQMGIDSLDRAREKFNLDRQVREVISVYENHR